MLGSFTNGLGFGVAFTLINEFSSTAKQIQQDMLRMSGVTDAFANSMIQSMSRIRVGVGMVIVSLIGLGFFAKAAKVDATFQNYEVALQAFLGNAREAHRVFEQIKNDAIANPKFSIDAFEKANVLLIAQGTSAEKAMQVVRDLGTVLLGVGGGASELNNVSQALEKIKATGFITGYTLRPLLAARLPIIQMFRDIGIALDPSRISKQRITFEQLSRAIHVSTLEGHLFGRVWGLMTHNISAQAAQLQENFTAAMGNIGKAIEPVTLFVLGALAKIVNGIQNFTSNPLGAWMARIALGVALVTLTFGLLLITMNIGRVTVAMLAKGFTGYTRALIMTTLAEKGVIAATWQMVKAIAAALIELWPILVIGGLIAGVVYIINRSLKEFDAVLRGTAAPADGFIGFLQKLGGILSFVGELFSSWDEKTQTFLVSTNMLKALNKLGILDMALNIATWIARMEAFWTGLKSSIREAWVFIKTGVEQVIDVFNTVFKLFGSFNTSISATTSNMVVWQNVGRAVGYTLMGIFASLAIIAITSAVSMIAAYWPFYLTVLAIIAALIYLKNVWQDLQNLIHGESKVKDWRTQMLVTPEQKKQAALANQFESGRIMNMFGNWQHPNAFQYPGFDNRRYDATVNQAVPAGTAVLMGALDTYSLVHGYSPQSKASNINEAGNIQITLINKLDGKEISREVLNTIAKDSATSYH